MDLEKLNKKIIADPLTGGEQTVYWNNEGTFLMCIPHKTIPMPDGCKPPEIKYTHNDNGTTTWEIIQPKQLPD